MRESVNVGLKEWATVCNALMGGRQTILLRKGGIYEEADEFRVEHPQFVLFPTYLHQNLLMLKESEQVGFEPHAQEPSRIQITAAAEVVDVVQLASREQMDAIKDAHIWSSALIDMRFMYRPENPLYLLTVRTYRLNEPVTVENTPAYAGCKSWVPLGREISTAGADVVMPDAAFERQRKWVLDRIEGEK